MYKLKLIFLLSITFSYMKIVAQNKSGQLLNVVPPSPNVASLGKYGEVPVSLYTGVPNISIPLYEIKDGDLDLPINLSYHAGGVKVEEIASSVGLGWTLNAGGVVGRNVRGTPDELGAPPAQSPARLVADVMKSQDAERIRRFVGEVDMGQRDGEFDIFYYNFNQFSGKFFYDQDGVVHTIPAKNLVITPVSKGWGITTEDGTVYTFNEVEEIRSSSCGGDQNTQAAWFLTSIKSLDGKREITFSYEKVTYNYLTLIGQTKYFSVNGTGNLCLQNPSPCLGSQNYQTHRLARIDFREGYVKFNYNTQRCDLPEDKSLDQMKVFTKDSQLVKAFSFGHSYFGNNADGCNYYTKDSKRLKLVSVTEENLTAQKPPYLFEYNESVQLPGRLSYAQDHWGYYNGKLNNPDLIAGFTTTVFSGAQVTFPGADRKANPETAQAGTLTKIKYPTGGETLFTYESNTVSDKEIEPTITTMDQLISFGASNDLVYRLPSPYESAELVIPAQGAQVQFSISGLELWQGCDFVQCYIIKDNNPTPFGRLGNSWNGVTATWAAGTYKLRLVSDCDMFSRASFFVSIKAQIPTVVQRTDARIVGGLRIKQIEDKPGNEGLSMIKKYLYHLENDSMHSSGVLVNFPDYGYDLGVSNFHTDEGNLPQGPADYCAYRVRQSFSNYPLATTQGSYVGYAHVIVDLGENGQSSYTFSAYPDYSKPVFPFAPVESFDWGRGFLLHAKDFIRRNNILTLARETINTPYSFNQIRAYGMKTGRDFYAMENGIMESSQQAQPKYNFYPTITEAYSLGQSKERIYDQNDPSKFLETVTDYTYSPKHLQLIKSKTVTSNSEGTMIEEIVSNKKYPFDYAFDQAPSGGDALGIKNLQDLHVVNAVIERYDVKQNRDTITNQVSNQRIVNGDITIYKKDKPYPDQLLRLEIGSPVPLTSFGNGSIVSADGFTKNANYKPAVIFNSYDEYGNITTQQKVADIKKSYVWGYNSQYPVAEVEGVDYATIVAKANLNQVVLQSTTTSDEDMRTELNKIRTSFPSAFVTTYTYKPLVGLSSQTDINNRTTYYEYDAFGRLILIRDRDKNILKMFCYNYAGQQENCTVANVNR